MYSQTLAERIRWTLRDTRGVVEKKMFGGVAFLRHGKHAGRRVAVVADCACGPRQFERTFDKAAMSRSLTSRGGR